MAAVGLCIVSSAPFPELPHPAAEPFPPGQCCQERVALADAEGAADLLGNDDAAEVVDAADNSSCFHTSIVPFIRFLLNSLWVPNFFGRLLFEHCGYTVSCHTIRPPVIVWKTVEIAAFSAFSHGNVQRIGPNPAMCQEAKVPLLTTSCLCSIIIRSWHEVIPRKFQGRFLK